ncbi:M81 family metallopeptidase [Haliscomenobacter sp.]|uniref:M81 family metallopeptidase n=1 Tax=Haliscomenobacter sp. TaxID=2717303 RepID=UPI003364EE34
MPFTVVIAELKQETNTSAAPTTLKDFEDFHLFFDDHIKIGLGKSNSEIAGFLEILEKQDVTIIPIIATFAVSGGPVENKTFDYLTNYLTEKLSKIEKADGVLIALHGALVSEDFQDGDSEILRRVREVVGHEIPICVTMDLHANVTESNVAFATTISGFHTCPHVDLLETGVRAARLLMGILKKEISPSMEFIKLPLVIPASNHIDFEPGTYKNVLDFAFSKESYPIIDISVFTVQPWLDIKEVGCSVVVIANDSKTAASQTAKLIANNIWNNRESLTSTQLLDPREAIAMALMQDVGPIILSDLADGTMAGSPGDSPVVLKAAIELDPSKTVFISICDPNFALAAKEIGAGRFISSKIGGTWGKLFYDPLEIEGQIISVENAEFVFTQKSYLGMKMNMGLTALIKISNIYLVVTSNPTSTTDPAYYSAVGLDVTKAQIVVVKTHAGFRDGYRNIARDFYLLDTPGMSSDNIKNLSYQNIERPKYPWDNTMVWEI